MSGISQSLPSFQTSVSLETEASKQKHEKPDTSAALEKAARSLPAIASKDSPKTSPPTFAPFSPPSIQQSSLEELNYALIKLQQALDGALQSTSESDKAKHIENIFTCLNEVNKKIPKGEIDLTQEAVYDIKRFYKLTEYCYKIINRTSAEKTKDLYRLFVFEKEQVEKLDQAAIALKEIHNSVLIKQRGLPPKKSSDYGLSFGTCGGTCFAQIKQSKASGDEETSRMGRFFQSAWHLNFKDVKKRSLDPREIGKEILAHPEKCPFIIQKAARVLSDPTKKEIDLIEDVRHDRAPLPRVAIESLIGKIAIETRQELSAKTREYFQKKITLEQEKDNKELDLYSIEHSETEVPNAHQKCEQLKKEIEALRKEIDELVQQSSLYYAQHETLTEIFKGAKKRKIDTHSFPQAILKRHGIQEGNEIFVEIAPFEKLSEKLKAVSDKKGTFILSFREPVVKDLAGHAVLLSFNPPFFSDINDTFEVTNKKKIRTFKTIDDLLAFLPHYFKSMCYLDAWQVIILTPYDKIASISAPSAQVTKVAKAADRAIQD